MLDNNIHLPAPLHISTTGRYSPLHITTVSFSNGSFTESSCRYIPIVIDHPVVVGYVSLINGGVISGNFDLGLYRVDGSKVFSLGSTAQSGANARQRTAIPGGNTLVGAGAYYMAFCVDNSTATFLKNAADPDSNGSILRAIGAKQQNSTFPLPTTANLSTAFTSTSYPLFSMETVQ